MNYRDVIYEEKQEEYKKMNKIMYRTLGNICLYCCRWKNLQCNYCSYIDFLQGCDTL